MIRRLKDNSGAGIALAALTVYVLFPSKEFYWDGIGFAAIIESARSLTDLFNPNHLVYNVIGWLFWKVLNALGLNLRALYALQTMDALLAAASVYLLWGICKTLTGSARVSDCWAVVFAFSATWWRFATDVNAYIAATFFLLLSFKLLLQTPHPNPYLVGLAHGAAMILHELALFFLPVAVAGLMMASSDSVDRRGRTKRIAAYGLTIAAIVGFAYSFGFFVIHPGGGWRDFWKWITVHSQDSRFSFDFTRNLRFTLRGTLRLFLGGRFTWLQSDGVTLAVGAAFCVFAAALARARRQPHSDSSAAPSERPKPLPSSNHCLVLIILWCISFTIFLFFWLPQNTFYRLLYLPALILLLAFVRVRRSSRIHLLFFSALTICVSNFAFLIYPLSIIQTNEVLAFALKHRSDWPSSSRIAFGEYHSDLWTISYFNTQAKWEYLPTAATAPESLRDDAEKQGQQLWLEGTAYDRIAVTQEGRAWLNSHIDPSNSLLHMDPPHQIRFYRVK